MSGRQVSTDQRSLRDRALAAREQFDASGTNISEWARERGFTAKLVLEVLRGDRRCVRGASHRVAVALGIKDDVPPPGPSRQVAVAAITSAPGRFEHAR
jgi:gp16 family phage-associated protein